MPASIPIGGLGLTLLSCCLTATVIGNAYYQKKQFYPSVVYITKSNPSMAAIYLMAFTMVILFGKLLKKIFFGTLRAAESEHLIERFFYAVTETCLAFTVFRDDFSPKFVALFTVLLFLKAFHWLSDYRVDYIERSPVITRLFHVRIASLLILLSTIDLLLVRHAYHSTMSLGASVQLVFGFEYAILLTVAYNIGIKYICHAIDLHSENPWENKAMYLLYTELFVGFIKVLLYIAFLLIMVRIHTFPLFIIRPMYLTMKSFKRALQDMLQSRRAIHNMNTLYPNASADDLQHADNVCIICREEMVLNTGVKKLPCNHLFHALCLRSWFQRQQTCPTCRLDVLRPTQAQQQQQQAQQQPPPLQQQQQQQQQQQLPQQGRRQPTNIMEFLQHLMDQEERGQRNNQPPQGADRPPAAAAAAPPAGPFGGFMPPFPPFPMIPPQLLHQIQQLQQQQQLQQEQQQQQAAASSASSGTESSATTTTTTTAANAAVTTSTSATTASNITSSTTASATTTPAQAAPTTTPPFPAMMPAPMFGAVPGPGAFPMPPFPPMAGLGGSFPPLPTPPANYSGLTTPELRAMEGRAKENIVARLQALDGVTTLVQAAQMQLTQYNQLMMRLAEFPSPTTTAAAPPAASTTTSASSLAATATSTSCSVTASSSSSTTSVPSSSGTSNGAVPSAAPPSTSSEGASGSGLQDIDPNSAEEVRRRRLQRFAADTDDGDH